MNEELDPARVNEACSQESVRRELSSGRQDRDLPWPAPPTWPFHTRLLLIKKEICAAQQARANCGADVDVIAELSAQAALTRAERRLRRWKQITFFSGWRPASRASR